MKNQQKINQYSKIKDKKARNNLKKLLVIQKILLKLSFFTI